MRVLLLGGTGNLGLRCIPALIAHSHVLTVYIRNIPKLHSLVSPALISQIHAIVQGDATDAAGIAQAIVEHDIEAIIDVAGNQVLPWKEYLLPKIATAVCTAATEVGRARGGKPLRVWVTSGLGCMEYPGTGGRFVQDYVGAPPAMDQHETTRAVVSAVPIADVRWSLICVAMMYPSDPQQGLFEPLQGPKHHNLLVQADVAAAWEHSWVENIPCIGRTIWLWVSQVWRYTAKYEYVADMLAEDLEKEDSQWLGKKVGYIEKEKIKSV